MKVSRPDSGYRRLGELHRKIAVEEYLSRSVAMLDHLRQQQNVLAAGTYTANLARCWLKYQLGSPMFRVAHVILGSLKPEWLDRVRAVH
jgi:hypothetical protein